MCIYIYVYVYIYMCIYIIYICIYIYVYVYVYIYGPITKQNGSKWRENKATSDFPRHPWDKIGISGI